MKLKDGLYRVETSYLCAGFVVKNNVIIKCAPILRSKMPDWISVAEWIGGL